LRGDHPDLLAEIEAGYKNMGVLWQLPFSHSDGLDVFSEVHPVPLVVRRSSLDRGTVEDALGIQRLGHRAVVFWGARGHLPATVLRVAAAKPQYLFLVLDPALAGCAENIRCIVLDRRLTFSDVLCASDVVVSKLGYGIVAECVAAKKRLLHPRREGFREDQITSTQISLYTNALELPSLDLAAGTWGEYLDQILDEPLPMREMRSDGAAVCAEALSRRL
jgi:hypothetical protein